jgi:hypothetical protein
LIDKGECRPYVDDLLNVGRSTVCRALIQSGKGAVAVKDKWYGDNRDLVKWGVLLKLASLYGASRIVQVAYYRPETIEIDGVSYPMSDAVMVHFSRSVMDIVRLNVDDFPKRSNRSHRFTAVESRCVYAGCTDCTNKAGFP